MANDFRGAESVHFYASPRTVELGVASYAGEPVTEVPSADGRGTVKPTSQNANKWGLAKGITSVLKRLSKKQLNDWGEKMAAKAAVHRNGKPSPAERFLTGELDEKAYIEECLQLKEEIGSNAADVGSAIHAQLERGYLGRPFLDNGIDGEAYFKAVKGELDRTYPGFEWVPEKPFWHPLGFGGRTDILGRNNGTMVIVDFKTRDLEPEHIAYALQARAKGQKTLGKLTPYETEPMQIAANLQGHGGMHGQRNKALKLVGGNLYVSRGDPSLVYMHEYKADELETAWQCFTALLTVDQKLSGVLGR